MKVFLNDKLNPITSISQLEKDTTKKALNGKFFYSSRARKMPSLQLGI